MMSSFIAFVSLAYEDIVICKMKYFGQQFNRCDMCLSFLASDNDYINTFTEELSLSLPLSSINICQLYFASEAAQYKVYTKNTKITGHIQEYTIKLTIKSTH